MSRNLFVLFVLAFAAMIMSGCDGDNDTGSNAGCPHGMSVVNGQYVCNNSTPIDQTIVQETIKRGQEAYDKAQDKASQSYTQQMQGSKIQQAAAVTCGFKGFKPGSMTECNP